MLLKAVEGHFLDGLDGEFSPYTMRIYRSYFDKFTLVLGDPEVDTITHTDLSKYMKNLRN
jgi:hypothetical protein